MFVLNKCLFVLFLTRNICFCFQDTTAKLWHMDNFEAVKTYKTDRPVNSAAISPLIYDGVEHVVLGE